MDFNEYNNIQMELGGIGDELTSNVRRLIMLSAADEETKELVQKVCSSISNSLNELSNLISRVARLNVD